MRIQNKEYKTIQNQEHLVEPHPRCSSLSKPQVPLLRKYCDTEEQSYISYFLHKHNIHLSSEEIGHTTLCKSTKGRNVWKHVLWFEAFHDGLLSLTKWLKNNEFSVYKHLRTEKTKFQQTIVRDLWKVTQNVWPKSDREYSVVIVLNLKAVKMNITYLSDI